MDKEIILRPKEDNSVTFSIRIDKELLKKYDELSNISGYSRNELINVAMKSYIEVVKFVPNENKTENPQHDGK